MDQHERHTLLCSTMELNERGVQLLVTGGQDKEAVAALAQSLGIVKQLLTNVEDEEEEQQQDNTYMMATEEEEEDDYAPVLPSCEELLQDEPIKMITLPHLGSQQGCQAEGSYDDETFIYDKVMSLNYIPPSPTSSLSQGGRSNVNVIKLHAGCVVYNLALAHHRRAKMMNGGCLNKAKTLYSMVDKLLPTDYDFTTTNNNNDYSDSGLCQSKLSPHELEVTFLLKLASLNNMAHIQYEQFCYDEAQDGLREIAQLMYQVEEAQNHQQQQQMIQQQQQHQQKQTNVRSLIQIHEWDGFVLNIMLLIPPTIAAAA